MPSIQDWAAKAAEHIKCQTSGLSKERIAAIIATFAEPLMALLRESRREHYHCGDSWYCCKRCAHSDHPSKWVDDTEACTCGADAWNARVDAVLAGGVEPMSLDAIPIDRQQARLAEIEARAQAATKGPWTSDGNEYPMVWTDEHQLARVFSGEYVRVSEMGKFSSLRRKNAEFIAHAREDIPYLLARLSAAEQGQQWQPIETAPKDGTTILATDGREIRATFWVEGQASPLIPEGIHCWSQGIPLNPRFPISFIFEPIYWMPLLAAPRGDK